MSWLQILILPNYDKEIGPFALHYITLHCIAMHCIGRVLWRHRRSVAAARIRHRRQRKSAACIYPVIEGSVSVVLSFWHARERSIPQWSGVDQSVNFALPLLPATVFSLLLLLLLLFSSMNSRNNGCSTLFSPHSRSSQTQRLKVNKNEWTARLAGDGRTICLAGDWWNNWRRYVHYVVINADD